MAKDPSVLWYWNDWQGGTITLSRHLKGCYMDLLHAQFNNGHLSLDEIKTVLGSDFGSTWPTLQKKFKTDEKGLFFNERLVFEIDKRSKYSKSRRDNLKGKVHMYPHMENENEIRKLEFIRNVELRKGDFSEKLIISFKEYWLEMNPNRTKFRFEGEKFFDFKKRLGTFQRNAIKFGETKTDNKLQEKDLTWKP